MEDWVTDLLKDYIGDFEYIIQENGEKRINCLLRRHVYAEHNQEKQPIYQEILRCMEKLAAASEPAIKLDKRQRTQEERQFFFRRMFTWVLVRVYEDYKDIEPYRGYRAKFSEMLNDTLSKRNEEEKRIRAKLNKSKRTIKEFLQVYYWIGAEENKPSFDKLSKKEKSDLIANHPNAVKFSKVNVDYLNKQLLINEYNNGSEFVKYEPVFSEKLSQVARNYVYALFLCDVEQLFFQGMINIDDKDILPELTIVEEVLKYYYLWRGGEYEQMTNHKENAYAEIAEKINSTKANVKKEFLRIRETSNRVHGSKLDNIERVLRHLTPDSNPYKEADRERVTIVNRKNS